MSFRKSLIAAAVIAIGLPAAANAATALVDVNLRTGPGIGYGKITAIPAGAWMDVYGCYDWCEVNYRGWRGFVSARFVGDAWRPAPHVRSAYNPYWRPVFYRPLFPLFPLY